MPILSAFFVNGLLLSVVLYYNDFKILEEFSGDINIFSLFAGVYYAITSVFSGGVVRAWAGISLVLVSVIDLGIPEAVHSMWGAASAFVGV